MTLTPVSPDALKGKRWLPPSQFDYARTRGIVELAAAELPHAVCTLPVGFLPQDDGAHVPVAVLGLDPAANLFIARDATWMGGYVPALLRAAPFALAATPEGERVLCVDDSVVYTQGELGHAFYQDNGEPSAALLRARDFIGAIHVNQAATRTVCAALHSAGLLRPWDLEVKTDSGVRRLEGLLCVDEDALNRADPATLHALHAVGALALAYCQLMSMQHVVKLGQLADAHARVDPSGIVSLGTGELNLEFLNQSDTISFHNI